MYRLEREAFLKKRFIAIWAVLGFQAGFINSFGFLACQRFVSHVTGFGTQVGVALAEGRFWLAVEMLGAPFFFILGAFLNGCITVARIERGKRPRYDWIMLLIPALIGMCAISGFFGAFGAFGENLLLPRDFMLLFTLSFVCGLQNGCFATMTRGQIRTTHLTGISTDIGTDLARVFFGSLEERELILIHRTNFSRIATFVAFTCGAIFSALLDRAYQWASLLVPMLTSIGVWLVFLRLRRILDLSAAAQARLARIQDGSSPQASAS